MRFYVYLGVTGDERTIASLHSELHLQDSETRALKHLRHNGDTQWIWRTRYIPVTSIFPEDALRDLLVTHKHLLPLIDRYRSQLEGTSAFIIAQCDEGDQPRGYSFSEDTVRLLAEFGASLEIDTVMLMEPT